MFEACFPLHEAEVAVGAAVGSTYGSDNWLTVFRANAAGDTLLVNRALLTRGTTQQLALVQA